MIDTAIPIASGRPDFTEDDRAIIEAIDATRPASLHGASPWVIAPGRRAILTWTEPWNHSRAYLAGTCGPCRDFPSFPDERPSWHPEATAWLGQHQH